MCKVLETILSMAYKKVLCEFPDLELFFESAIMKYPYIIVVESLDTNKAIRALPIIS